MLSIMSEAEKQEGQKTVVSFITGLLIGGLLVWVFSSSPEEVVAPETEETTTEVSTGSEDTKTTEEVTNSNSQINKVDEVVVRQEVTGKGTLTVQNQKEGATVALGTVTTPTDAGWVVVRDYANSTAGNILGAARYNAAEGLMPTIVHLLRNTKKGSEYQVSFYGDNGDKVFDTKEDSVSSTVTDTFKAE